MKTEPIKACKVWAGKVSGKLVDISSERDILGGYIFADRKPYLSIMIPATQEAYDQMIKQLSRQRYIYAYWGTGRNARPMRRELGDEGARVALTAIGITRPTK